MHRRTASLSLPALALALLHRKASAQSMPSPAPEGNLPLGVIHPAFDQLARKIEAEYPDVESVVVVRKSRVLFDHYKSSPDTLRDAQSVTKSVLSLAVGAALARGAIQSFDQPVGVTSKAWSFLCCSTTSQTCYRNYLLAPCNPSDLRL